MKKIGIFTFHRSINYGAFMQAYALSKRIKARFLGVEVEIIDYASKLMEDHYVPRLSLSAVKHPVGFFFKKKQYAEFRKALDKLPLSEKKTFSDGNTEEVLSTYEDDYDVFVVGSDAVWNWCKRGFPNPYLLGFRGEKIKMSYAASAYGMDGSYVGDREREYFARSLQGFSFIGVRDEYTKSLVKDVLPTAEPRFTCDPTVLLSLDDVYAELGESPEEFKARIYKKLGLSPERKLIGLMGADNGLIDRINERFGKEYVTVNLYNLARSAKKQLLSLTPFEWAAVFSLFSVTVTNYFHGTLLSLRNFTPVVNFDYTSFSKTNEGKICDVMRRMDLSECHFKERSQTEEIISQIDRVLKERENYSKKIKENILALEDSSNAFFDAMEELIK